MAEPLLPEQQSKTSNRSTEKPSEKAAEVVATVAPPAAKQTWSLVPHLLRGLRIVIKCLGSAIVAFLAVAVGIYESTVLRDGAGFQVPESLRGWNAVITGSTSGMGFEAAKLLVSRGATVLVHGPDPNRTRRQAAMVGHAAKNGGKVLSVAADLTDFGAVRRLASEAQEMGRIDLLFLNAAFQYAGAVHEADAVQRQGLGPKDFVGASGHDRVMATNHLGHYLLTQLLHRSLAEDARIVVVTSCCAWHSGTYERLMRGSGQDRIRWEKRPQMPFLAYWDSKLANVCFSRALRKRLGNRALVILHDPGLMHSAIALPREARAGATHKEHETSKQTFDTMGYRQFHLSEEFDTWSDWKYSTEDAGKHLLWAAFVTRRPIPDSVNPYFMPSILLRWYARPDMAKWRIDHDHGLVTYSWVRYARYSFGNMYASLGPECGEDFEDRHWEWSKQQVGLTEKDSPL